MFFVFSFDLFGLLLFYFVCKHEIQEETFQAEDKLANEPTVGSEHLALLCWVLGVPRGAGGMQPLVGFIPAQDHPRSFCRRGSWPKELN